MKSKAETHGAEGESGRSRRWITEQNGDPGKTRTSDTQFRKLLLYPPELRGPFIVCYLQVIWAGQLSSAFLPPTRRNNSKGTVGENPYPRGYHPENPASHR